MASTSNDIFFFVRQNLYVLLSFGVLLLSLAWQLWRSSKKPALPLPPGSLGLPFFGESLIYVRYMKRNRSRDFLAERVARHGDTFKTSLLGYPTVVVSNPAGNKMLFTNENHLVRVSWPSSVIAILGKSSLIALRGEEAKRIRQAMLTFLRPEALQMYAAKADESVRAFMRDHWEGKTEVKVFPLMKKFTFSLACELLMSRYMKQEQEMLELPFTTMMKGMMQLPIKLPGSRYAKGIAAANMLRNYFQSWIDERRRDLAAGKSSRDGDLLSCLLTYVHDDGKPLSDESIKDNILLMLFAGHDTSTALTTMVCKFLASNQGIFYEVYRENKQIMDEKGGPDEPLSWADIQKMKLSWRVVQETLRLQPPVQGSFREAIKDFEYSGFRILKSWKLYWTTNSTHHNPKYFSDPAKFDPSRFEGAGPAPYTFLPFGGGPRMCPGNIVHFNKQKKG